MPSAPLLPIEATTTMPASTSASEAAAVGEPGQLLNASPIDMFRMSIPSASAASMAAIITSSVTEPAQPKTR